MAVKSYTAAPTLSWPKAKVSVTKKPFSWLRSVIKSVQIGRMISVLSNLTDTQLAEIGISRSGIPDYAAKLVSDGGDAPNDT